MIEITRLDGRSMLVNENLIETVEATPDTVIILANGRKIIVRESLTEVMNRCNERGTIQTGGPLVSAGEDVQKCRVRETVHNMGIK
ncbi:flagellar FlbD family protein [Butyrivibrio sp. AE3004]|uniref:flagellar FlbD family protein n=1 Tax=Butyrivibrio sp. AE3004 TaxID=1506994 RepID=UPI0005627553|nr:flagellar FlbD family protein [Butyrivibrio sp. AE3004]